MPSGNGVGIGGVFDPTRDYAPTGQWTGWPILQPVIPSAGATVVLLPSQSNSTFLFDRAAGVTYTLPPPQVGLTYTFFVTVTRTSNNDIVQTDSTASLMQGSIWMTVAAGTGTQFFPNGTSNYIITMNGTTTGGIKFGTFFFAQAYSTSGWIIDGTMLGSGTIATPFSG